jgi:hypothetical protein
VAAVPKVPLHKLKKSEQLYVVQTSADTATHVNFALRDGRKFAANTIRVLVRDTRVGKQENLLVY